MEKKPITPFLKVTSILHMIYAILGAFVGILALLIVVLLPELEAEAGVEITPYHIIALAVSVICTVVDIVMAIMALRHTKLNIVYAISVITYVASAVFGVTDIGGSVSDYISVAVSFIIPGLFLIAVFKQKKLDEGK